MRRSAVVSDAIEFEPGELLRELLRRSWVIVLCTIIAAMAVLLVSMFFVEPVYESCTKVYILSRQQGDAGLTYSDLQTAEQLTSDYEELIKSRFVLETVLADLGLDMSADELARAVTVASPVGTRILEITVENKDPYLARDIANQIREVSGERIVEIMRIDAVNLVDEANLPMKPSKPDIRRNTLIGAAVGLFIGLAAAVLQILLNDLICTPDDVERYLGLSVLGVIPAEEKPKGGKRRADA